MRMVSVSATTVELAVAEGLRQLNVGRERAEVVVKTAPSKGFFGFGARPAVVEVSIIEDPVADAELFLREMFVTMRLAIKVNKQVKGREVTFDLSGDRVALLIGKQGRTLDAIQLLVNAVGNKYAKKPFRFIVDAEGYRERHRQKLVYQAKKLADKAVLLGREISMEPMVASDRKIIHNALQERNDVKTESRGEEPNRAIVIVPKTLKRANRVIKERVQ
ncbi:RNA-binding cell elongation regulator Jag/EloR [Sulfoacidibacillus thermotolerans]|uniref:RNA-binding protein KhpB n=1 Tax=Sulfoacidibacillus thermotolerans TaxID=1765684 RepID=A0A2U3D6A1_SULT2|nr:RNA-binding cell elongation regulator Jag/EloR [Sulfoacidibacillus thermotolerans]PWI56811.1 hypothetical protein BM613_11695 [Sulfoacidibacillus thermotolerans]